MDDLKTKKRVKANTQVLVRLPVDLAQQFDALVPSRARSRFLVELLRRELARERDELVKAAQLLNAMEAKDAQLNSESQEWLDAVLVEEDDPFDEDEFLRQFNEAQKQKR